MLVFEFTDGATMKLYDGEASTAENVACAEAVATESVRRERAGLPGGGTIRDARDSDEISNATARAA